MKKLYDYLPLLVLLSVSTALHGIAPTVSNVVIHQEPGTFLLNISYDLTDSDSDALYVTLEISEDGGTTWTVPSETFVNGSDIGAGVTPGFGKSITWNGGADWPGNYTENLRVRVTADDGDSGPGTIGNGFVLIPSSSFYRGDALDEGNTEETPRRQIQVNAFYMAKTEVTWAEWNEVRDWAIANDYSINAGNGKGDRHPVFNVNWYDVVKWCNAKSEREGLDPVYYTDSSKTEVYRRSDVNVAIDAVDWGANGYRLPTEAEWEKAARGGLDGYRYAWDNNNISHSRANYQSYSSEYGDLSGGAGYHPDWITSSGPFTSIVGSFPETGYGLYDVIGNVAEWVYDWSDYTSYDYYSTSTSDNPKGPEIGDSKIFRGGDYLNSPFDCRVSNRERTTPSSSASWRGFRIARTKP